MNSEYQRALDYYNIGNLNTAADVLISDKANIHNPDHLFLLGVIFSKKGDMQSAIQYYKNVIEINPSHIEAVYNLALCYQNIGDDDPALEYYQKAVTLNPFLSEAHNNLAILYKKRNNNSEAEKHYNLAVKSKPDNRNAISNLHGLQIEKNGSAELKQAAELFEKGEYRTAADLLEDLNKKYPENIEILNSLATLHFHQNDIVNAIRLFKHIIEINPADETAYYSLGVCFQNQEDNNSALTHYLKCIELNPNHLDSLNNLGLLYSALKNYEEAEKCFRTVIESNPEYFNAYTNLGSLLITQDKYHEAFQCFTYALSLTEKENNVNNKSVALSNLGFIKLRQQKLDEAISYFDQALELNPESVLAHYNKAETLFMAGRLQQAWKHYEYRTGRKDFGKRHFHKMPSSLDELSKKRVLVYAEQGLGDAFQFIRYIPLLKEKDCYIIFECDKSIFGLLKNFPGIDELLERDLLNSPDLEYDYDLPLLTLPLLFNTSLESIPANVPYLFADEELSAKWRTVIGEEKFRIGVVWAGNPTHSNDRHRSVRLSKFLNLFSIQGTRFFSLQKGFPLIQAKDYQLMITNLDDYGIKSFSDTAAILTNLDLLITVDTSVAHLAGAMGIPVWILLPNLPDWRWMLERNDSPWYPTARLFRQPSLGDWDSVFKDLNKELRVLTSNEENTSMKNEGRDFKLLNAYLDNIQNQVYSEPLTLGHSQLTEIAFEKILANYKIEKQAKILDVGCGQGPALELFTKNGFNPIGITLSREDVQYCRTKGFEVFEMDQSFITFPDDSFELIWARHILEHSIMPLFTLNEYYRLLSSGGLVYLEVPGYDTEVHHEENPNHYSIFPLPVWRTMINRSGFKILEEFQTKIKLLDGKNDEYYSFVCRKSSTHKLLKKLYLGLSSGENFGWGVCSKYLRAELSQKIKIENLDELQNIKNKSILEGPVFHALTPDFDSLFPIRGTKNYGYTFFEYELSDSALKNASNYDIIFTGSTWNKEKLAERGIFNTEVLIQGIDPVLFYEGEKLKSNDLFVIFSGGKFELRKGQDLVLKAFKILSEKYPDMILINAWYNMWPETVKSMYHSKHIKFEYTGETWKNFMVNLCRVNDIDGNRVFTLPITPNEKLRDVYLNSDIGLFPNRCEGGTNLVLMEYMACGKPVIASYTSGHKDVLDENNSFRIMKMNEYKISDGSKLLADWQEPEIDEIVSQLEYAYHHRDEIKAVGKRGAATMRNFTWTKSAEVLVKKISDNL